MKKKILIFFCIFGIDLFVSGGQGMCLMGANTFFLKKFFLFAIQYSYLGAFSRVTFLHFRRANYTGCHIQGTRFFFDSNPKRLLNKLISLKSKNNLLIFIFKFQGLKVSTLSLVRFKYISVAFQKWYGDVIFIENQTIIFNSKFP